MALLEKQLVVRKSRLPHSGKGLFTKKFIPKGARIVEYKGKISSWKDVKDEDGKNGYIFYVNRNHVIDALPTKKALARYANDARGLSRVPGVTNNADYITDGLKAYIEARRDIQAGEEILVDYGKDYWKVIRENLKLRAEEARNGHTTNGHARNGHSRNGHALKNGSASRNGVKHQGKKIDLKKTKKLKTRV